MKNRQIFEQNDEGDNIVLSVTTLRVVYPDLKVVNIAVSCLTATRRLAIV